MSTNLLGALFFRYKAARIIFLYRFFSTWALWERRIYDAIKSVFSTMYSHTNSRALRLGYWSIGRVRVGLFLITVEQVDILGAGGRLLRSSSLSRWGNNFFFSRIFIFMRNCAFLIQELICVNIKYTEVPQQAHQKEPFVADVLYHQLKGCYQLCSSICWIHSDQISEYMGGGGGMPWQANNPMVYLWEGKVGNLINSVITYGSSYVDAQVEDSVHSYELVWGKQLYPINPSKINLVSNYYSCIQSPHYCWKLFVCCLL